MITASSEAPQWAHRLAQDISDEIARIQARRAPVPLASFLKADLPNAATYTGHWIYVRDATGGAVPAFSNGTNWLRADTSAVIS